MEVIDPGHVYWIPNLESRVRPEWAKRLGCWLAVRLTWLFGGQAVVFIKRSSKMVQHLEEHPGSNTQEYFRVTIDRSKYLDALGHSDETMDTVYYLSMALWCYEARAYRRKQQKLNKQAQGQAEMGSSNATRDGWDDVPFSELDIEHRPVGSDGHIILGERDAT